jgi:hypothetical protein
LQPGVSGKSNDVTRTGQGRPTHSVLRSMR